jgi:hypothetical protein
MVTFNVRKEMDLEEWKDHVLGSGAFSWEWWIEVEEGNLADPDGGTEEGIAVTWYDDADNPDESATPSKFLTYQEIADKCSELAQTHNAVAQQLRDDDFDACYMDCVLQYAFIGEIRYG